MHIVLRYYESTGNTRDDKVKDTLKTMGASILVGGLSTCLGVIPLAFASSAVLRTVFVSFIAMVTLGVGHGLILLPVLLSYVGPTVSVRLNKHVILHEQKSLEDGDIVAATSKVAMSTTEEHEASDEPASVSGKAAEGEFGAPSHQGYPRSVTSDSSDAPLVLLNSPKISGASPQRNNKGTAEAAILAFMEEVSNASYAPVHQNIAAKEDDSDGEGDGAVEDRAEDAWILDVTPSTDSYINHVDC